MLSLPSTLSLRLPWCNSIVSFHPLFCRCLFLDVILLSVSSFFSQSLPSPTPPPYRSLSSFTLITLPPRTCYPPQRRNIKTRRIFHEVRAWSHPGGRESPMKHGELCAHQGKFDPSLHPSPSHHPWSVLEPGEKIESHELFTHFCLRHRCLEIDTKPSVHASLVLLYFFLLVLKNMRTS